SSGAERLLLDYPWPGNSRELRNLFERTMWLENGETREPQHLKLAPRARAVSEASLGQPVDDLLNGALTDTGIPFESLVEELERALILRASYATKWNQSRTADLLNLKRDKLRYRMKLYELGPEETSNASET